MLTIAAKEWHWIEASPMTGVRLLKQNNARVRCLTDDSPDAELPQAPDTRV
jgi:hypothetical protein